MVVKKPLAGWLVNPGYELENAIQRAERGLAAAAAEGFREVVPRLREAVLQCERLVVVVDPARQGLHGRQRPGAALRLLIRCDVI